MLSYRHGFHAGNFADVMKHVVLASMLRYMTRKDAPICYVETHAGAGVYDLNSEHAQKNRESDSGIARIRSAANAPEAVKSYLDVVSAFGRDADHSRYPGSPLIAATLLRSQDRLMLCELHSSDFPSLKQTFRKDRRVHCFNEDGYRFSKGLLPPAERRGLVLMDPSYELAKEYDTAIEALAGLHRRFPTGTFALWYPILDQRRTVALRLAVQKSAMRDVVDLELQVADRKTAQGMYGCGMIVVNPPWSLREEMELTLPWLASTLGMDDTRDSRIDQWVDE